MAGCWQDKLIAECASKGQHYVSAWLCLLLLLLHNSFHLLSNNACLPGALAVRTAVRAFTRCSTFMRGAV